MTPSRRRRHRLENALEGMTEQPPVSALSFVSVAVLSEDGTSEPDDPAGSLAATAGHLEVDAVFVPAKAPWAPEAVRRLQEEGRAVIWAVDGPLWEALESAGVSEGLKATAWEPESLEPGLDRANARGQDEILAGAGLGVDAVVIADDLAGTTGPLISPDYFNEHLVQQYSLLVATSASAGLRAILHTDGDARAFLPGIARAGFIGIHGCGGLGVEVFERVVVAARSQGLTLIGGLDTARLADSERAVRAGTRASVLAGGGGLIVSDDGGITTTQELAGLAAALRAAGVGG